MIDLNENTYCLGLWYVQGDREDFLAAATRQSGGAMKITYRFRYYHSDEPWDEKDIKRWYEAAPPPNSDEDSVVALIDGLVSELVNRGYATAEPWRAIIKGGPEAAFEALKAAPFTHLRESPIN